MHVNIEQHGSVRKFWQSKSLAFRLQWEYQSFLNLLKSELYPLEAEPIEGLPEHFLYPLPTGHQVYYQVKQISLEPVIYLVTIKRIATSAEIVSILLPEIKKSLLQQPAQIPEIVKSQQKRNFGRIFVNALDIAQRLIFSQQVLSVLAGLFLTILVTFGQQFASPDTPPGQKALPPEQKSSQSR
ncbi:hypothetical protein H6S82_17050 [Planktothrix sp. FACHB-1355]|uniref:Uncharacterized protein n=1 Tax=Aerosakkonema funiforme FACHB-1375 TaxID=2949571 RepID=A0A926ZDZ3_9CYAN|nr:MULTISPECIES: hypothetical protein [Oscillatoriales]MBD2179528.1 hypothetical protein [Aerosakkonema funiforme FACHB-1375]MBD3560546.1 hypothetical protein [Planktothrix sp. FACHB-1355]